MRHAEVTLDDKFLLTEGRVFITGVQALLRVLMDQHRLDRASGLKTAGFVSGYRGSPLGGLDQQAHRAGKFLTAADVVVGSAVRWGTMFKIFPERDAFKPYIERLAARPALQRAEAKDKALAA